MRISRSARGGWFETSWFVYVGDKTNCFVSFWISLTSHRDKFVQEKKQCWLRRIVVASSVSNITFRMMMYRNINNNNIPHNIVLLIVTSLILLITAIITTMNLDYNPSSSTITCTSASTSFLRRLVDMLSENEDVISFYAGSANRKGQKALGRIVVHDRIKVEAEILPRYFNHSSFASLRRQLNYFSFTRIGKGRQRGAVYENEGVIVLDDILHLRRRSTVAGALGGEVNSLANECSTRSRNAIKAMKGSGKKSRSVSLESLSSTSSAPGPKCLEKAPKKPRIKTVIGQTVHRPAMYPPTIVSPRTSPLHSPSTHFDEDEPKIILDLTVPPVTITPISRHSLRYAPAQQLSLYQTANNDDAEVLAGCEALLCFSQGLHSSLTV